MNRIVHFEIALDKPEETSQFYTDVFGWKVNKWEGPQPYWLVTTGEDKEPGINGGLMKRPAPNNAKVITTLEVASLEEMITKVEQNGGKLITPKTTIPGIGYFCYVADPEGILHGLMQTDKNAK